MSLNQTATHTQSFIFFSFSSLLFFLQNNPWPVLFSWHLLSNKPKSTRTWFLSIIYSKALSWPLNHPSCPLLFIAISRSCRLLLDATLISCQTAVRLRVLAIDGNVGRFLVDICFQLNHQRWIGLARKEPGAVIGNPKNNTTRKKKGRDDRRSRTPGTFPSFLLSFKSRGASKSIGIDGSRWDGLCSPPSTQSTANGLTLVSSVALYRILPALPNTEKTAALRDWLLPAGYTILFYGSSFSSSSATIKAAAKKGSISLFVFVFMPASALSIAEYREMKIQQELVLLLIEEPSQRIGVRVPHASWLKTWKSRGQ